MIENYRESTEPLDCLRWGLWCCWLWGCREEDVLSWLCLRPCLSLIFWYFMCDDHKGLAFWPDWRHILPFGHTHAYFIRSLTTNQMRLPSLKYLGFDEEMYRGPQVLFGSNFLSDRIKAIFCRLALKKNTTEGFGSVHLQKLCNANFGHFLPLGNNDQTG